MSNSPITVETTVNAPAESVWTAWNTPEDIKQWNAASDDWHTTASEVDLREGGRFSSRMESKDGVHGFDFGGVLDMHAVIIADPSRPGEASLSETCYHCWLFHAHAMRHWRIHTCSTHPRRGVPRLPAKGSVAEAAGRPNPGTHRLLCG